MAYNKVILLGNLTRDPQLKYLPSQTPVAEFGLAMNRKFRTQQGEDREEVTFVDCAAFGRTGEVINEYFTKGKPIFIEGRLKYDSWEDKSGGGKRSRLTVVVDNFQFVGSGTQSDSERHIDDSTSQEPPRGSRGSKKAPAGRQHLGPYPPQETRTPVDPPFSESDQQFKEDDIPF